MFEDTTSEASQNMQMDQGPGAGTCEKGVDHRNHVERSRSCSMGDTFALPNDVELCQTPQDSMNTHRRKGIQESKPVLVVNLHRNKNHQGKEGGSVGTSSC